MAIKLTALGATLVAINDIDGSIIDAKGIDPLALYEHKNLKGSLNEFNGNTLSDRQSFFNYPVDILIPAALENQITETEAESINAKLIAEGANGPITPEAEDILQSRGVDIIPDVLANAGGVIVSYTEWLQNNSRQSWDESEVQIKLKKKLINAYKRSREIAEEQKVDLRTACYWNALKHLDSVKSQLGIFP